MTTNGEPKRAPVLDEDPEAVTVNSLTYAYPGQGPFISDFTLKLATGSRCLLIGANGSGEHGAGHVKE